MYAEHSKNLASFGSWERRGESDRQAFQNSGGGVGGRFCHQVTDNKPASKGTNQMSSVTDDCDKKNNRIRQKEPEGGIARKAA